MAGGSDWKGFFRDIFEIMTFRRHARLALLIWLLALLVVLRALGR